jgi:hypothetical protein
MKANERAAVRACDRFAMTLPEPTTDYECDCFDFVVARVVGERYGIDTEKLVYLWTCEAPNVQQVRQFEADYKYVSEQKRKERNDEREI